MLNRCKTWLRNSEIGEFLDWQHPFIKALPYPDYPMARIHGESFWTGITDTFDVLIGDHYEEENHFGVLDILIFPLISYLLLMFLIYLYDKNDSDNLFIFLLCTIFVCIVTSVVWPVMALLELARYLLGMALTVLLTPVIAVVHIAAYFFEGKNDNKEIEQTKIVKAQAVSDKGQPLGSTQKITDKNLLDILLDKEDVPRRFVPIYTTCDEKNETDTAAPQGILISKNVILTHLNICYVKHSWSGNAKLHYSNIFIDMAAINCKAAGALLRQNAAEILTILDYDQKERVQECVKKYPNKTLRTAFFWGATQAAFNNGSAISCRFFKHKQFEPKLLHHIFEFAGIAPPKIKTTSTNTTQRTRSRR